MSVLVTSHRHCSRQPFEDSRLIVDDRSRHKSAGVAVRCVAVQCSACGAVRTCVGVADVHDDLALLLGQYGHVERRPHALQELLRGGQEG
eukprot:5876608-Pyramimonas_sp.AAC.3